MRKPWGGGTTPERLNKIRRVALCLTLAVILSCSVLFSVTVFRTNAAEITKTFTLSGSSAAMHAQWDAAYAEIAANPTSTYKVILANDWQPTQTLVFIADGNLIFDLNGYTVDGTESTGYLFCNVHGAAMVLEFADSSKAQTGTIKNFSDRIVSMEDPELRNKNKVKISGGTITNNNVSGSLFSYWGTFEMTGGVITNNHTKNAQSTMLSFAGNTKTSSGIKITGGAIIGNTAGSYVLYTDRNIEMTGGKIANNMAVNGVRSGGGNVSISGSEIYMNTGINGEAISQVIANNQIEITGGTIVAPNGADPIDGECTIDGTAKVFSGSVQSLTAVDSGNNYQIGDQVVLSKVTAHFANANSTQTADIVLLPNEYTVTYGDDNHALVKGANTVTVAYGGQTTALTLNAICVHDWGEWSITKQPSVTETGAMQRECQICHEIETAELPKHVHEFTDTVVLPTCTAQGYTLHTCTGCEYNYQDAYVAALGHTWHDWTVVTAATTAAPGKEQRTCDVCGTVETRVLAQLIPEPTPTPDNNQTPVNNQQSSSGLDIVLTAWMSAGVAMLLILVGVGLTIAVSHRRKSGNV